ncbi:glycoside hydrolase superfamily [Aspergillus tetrazonus]
MSSTCRRSTSNLETLKSVRYIKRPRVRPHHVFQATTVAPSNRLTHSFLSFFHSFNLSFSLLQYEVNTLLVAVAAGTAMAAPQLKKRAGFTFFGVTEAGAEFGEQNIPGVWGTDYTFPDTESITTLISKGFNTFRIPFLMERLTPEMRGSFDEGYLKNLTSVVNAVTNAGAWAIVDAQNFGRLYVPGIQLECEDLWNRC